MSKNIVRRTPSEVKALWVGALRSGRYQQTTQVLRRVARDGGEFFCCLGVLCDLASKDGGDDWCTSSNQTQAFGALNVVVSPPEAMSKWLGLTNQPLGRGLLKKLMKMNDEDRKSFSEIADYIEENLITPKQRVKS